MTKRQRHHPLKVWLFDHGESAAAFARRVGVSQTFLSAVLRYESYPSMEMLVLLIGGTRGALDANAFLPPRGDER